MNSIVNSSNNSPFLTKNECVAIVFVGMGLVGITETFMQVVSALDNTRETVCQEYYQQNKFFRVVEDYCSTDNTLDFPTIIQNLGLSLTSLALGVGIFFKNNHQF